MGEKVVRQHITEMATQTARSPIGPVVVGLDGGGCNARRYRRLRSCWTGGTLLCVLSTCCRRRAVSAPMRPLQMRRFII